MTCLDWAKLFITDQTINDTNAVGVNVLIFVPNTLNKYT